MVDWDPVPIPVPHRFGKHPVHELGEVHLRGKGVLVRSVKVLSHLRLSKEAVEVGGITQFNLVSIR